ncbi:DUF3311 domain-containing protein [Actinomadura sp. KC216]|uniref:DUF3311 domain-containing protein n=1 Tax=Actinomadura sp. KC216 TaxID=2530370 RepID=UPI00104F5211|nr:DUF3311 domain-containing protein [Actinomadura sp. KC216]TDB89533.1 DUF3311 domain-containing protein [Actinomadura sp. KC216]
MAPENPKVPVSKDTDPPPPSRPSPPPPAPPSGGRSDRSPWNWLLLLPVAVPLMTFLYNSDEPRLAGFPAFYWIQLAFILLGVSSTVVVYRMTRKRG